MQSYDINSEMNFVRFVLFAICCVSLVHPILNQESDNMEELDTLTPKSVKETDPPEHHTFVALIDIVFTDGSKRTCTGTIIHENVVITAAHCFIQEYNPSIKPELTASFVVIGTKKMYETGYEQYLPIERVVTHPKFKAWTADLSLVFTFAAMTSDKPGTVIPLAGDQGATPVDSSVTVFSWGHCKEEIEKMEKNTPTLMIKKQLSTCPPDDTSCIEQEASIANSSAQESRFTDNKQKLRILKLREKKLLHTWNSNFKEAKNGFFETVKRISRYLSPSEILKFDDNEGRLRQRSVFGKQMEEIAKLSRPTKHDRLSEYDYNTSLYRLAEVRPFKMKSYYRSWRRQMGSMQNQLVVVSFDLMNIQLCRKIIQKTMPAIYTIKHGNEVMCYSSEEHYITGEDAGAPAVRNGQLVAVTVGGAECDGDHIALGMKMSCYCAWIARHLPGGGDHLNCCKDCCLFTEDVNT